MNSVNSYSSSSNVASSQLSGGGIEAAMGRATMSPEDIIAYVTAALSNIDGELEYWKTTVEQRQEKARKVRELLTTIRANTGDQGATGNTNFDVIDAALKGAKADPMLNQDPSLMETIEGLEKAEKRDNADGRWIDADCLAQGQKGLEDKLSALNSDNELVMMNLQKLMQQRNQVSQFSSNALNLINETLKSVIGNLR